MLACPPSETLCSNPAPCLPQPCTSVCRAACSTQTQTGSGAQHTLTSRVGGTRSPDAPAAFSRSIGSLATAAATSSSTACASSAVTQPTQAHRSSPPAPRELAEHTCKATSAHYESGVIWGLGCCVVCSKGPSEQGHGLTSRSFRGIRGPRSPGLLSHKRPQPVQLLVKASNVILKQEHPARGRKRVSLRCSCMLRTEPLQPKLHSTPLYCSLPYMKAL